MPAHATSATHHQRRQVSNLNVQRESIRGRHPAQMTLLLCAHSARLRCQLALQTQQLHHGIADDAIVRQVHAHRPPRPRGHLHVGAMAGQCGCCSRLGLLLVALNRGRPQLLCTVVPGAAAPWHSCQRGDSAAGKPVTGSCACSARRLHRLALSPGGPPRRGAGTS